MAMHLHNAGKIAKLFQIAVRHLFHDLAEHQLEGH